MLLTAYLLVMLIGHVASALFSMRVSPWAALANAVLGLVASVLLITEVL